MTHPNFSKTFDDGLIKKYQWAGKIRFISFTILFLFLLLLKTAGGYAYLNPVIISLVFIEAALNQPYPFLVRRVNLYRLQFYQMVTDIIAITWFLYYMGGIEAPLINLGYYVVILWAGVVSDMAAVFFAVVGSSILFACVVAGSHFGILPAVSYFDVKIPTAQMLSILLGHVSFFFAFGYFSARSAEIAKALEKKKQEESLRHVHKFLAAGYLIAGIAHDIVNHLITIRAYTKILLEREASENPQDKRLTNEQGLKRIEEAERNSADLLAKLISFSQKPKENFKCVDVNLLAEEALGLTHPMLKMADIRIERAFCPQALLVMADKDQLQEVFVALILNALDAIGKKGKIWIWSSSSSDNAFAQLSIKDSGCGIPSQDLSKIKEAFYSTKASLGGLGLGLTIAHEIVARHNGEIKVESAPGQGALFSIFLPLVQPAGARG